VLAYHLILSAYGFWLPNDPRGSWSDFVRAWELLRFGPATKTNERRSLARRPHDREIRLAAKRALARPPVVFDGLQARAIARGFAGYVERSGALVFACAVMPDHAHLVIARHNYSIERIANLLKGNASSRLSREGRHPFANNTYRDGRLPSPWARGEWSCFLDSVQDIRRAIAYVERNPTREGMRAQRWSFVRQFDPELLRYL
jgi:REP element-mobilizing transposase RayT